jgi:hypothetical protein
MAAAARHRVMRTLGFVLALVLGFMCWAIVLALSGGVAPLGKVGAYEALRFFAPIAIFAAPLAVFVLVRGHSLTAIWIAALAPILGFGNFALSMSVALANPNPPDTTTNRPPTFALAWALLLVCVLAALAVSRRLRHPAARER